MGISNPRITSPPLLLLILISIIPLSSCKDSSPDPQLEAANKRDQENEKRVQAAAEKQRSTDQLWTLHHLIALPTGGAYGWGHTSNLPKDGDVTGGLWYLVDGTAYRVLEANGYDALKFSDKFGPFRVVPLPGGGAYAWSNDDIGAQEVWFLQKANATKLPITTHISHIKPCVDGGAYAYCDDPDESEGLMALPDRTGGVWYLKAATAKRIICSTPVPKH